MKVELMRQEGGGRRKREKKEEEMEEEEKIQALSENFAYVISYKCHKLL